MLAIPLLDLFESWRRVATVKPPTATETLYVLKLVIGFVGHGDAVRITRDDMKTWRDAAEAGGTTNNMFNNRLSMVRQVFAWGVACVEAVDGS